MIKAIAIDDEPVALAIISGHAEKIPFLTIEGSFLSAMDGMHFLTANPVDLIFLDISMPGSSGLELSAMIGNMAQVIFTTAYPEYAIQGFELAATDYLLKPINFSRFLKACQLAEDRAQTNYLKPVETATLFVKDSHRWIAVTLSDILYIRGEDNYASIFVNGKRILTRMTLTELQNKLPAHHFLRVHKSYIIPAFKIEQIEKKQVTVAGVKIPMSLFSMEALLQTVSRFK